MEKKTFLSWLHSAMTAGNVFAHYDADRIPEAMTKQCFKLLKTENKLSSGCNIMISPCNLMVNLAMLTAGADGNTGAQLRTAFAFPDNFAELIGRMGKKLNQTGSAKLSTFNSVFVDEREKIRSTYDGTIRQDFGGQVIHSDFSQIAALVETINREIEKHTDGVLKNVVSMNDMQNSSGLVFVNTIYFHAEWEIPFLKCDTEEMDFFLREGETVRVDMMEMTENIVYFASSKENVKGIVLPYKDRRFEMIALLPYRDENDPGHILDGLTNGRLDKWMAKRNGNETEVWLPKIRMTDRRDLVPGLKLLGVHDAFVPTDDFVNGIGLQALWVNKILHVVNFDLDEEKTEAAAATITICPVGCFPQSFQKPELNYFHANRPFVVLIRERQSGAVLFSGVINNPVES